MTKQRKGRAMKTYKIELTKAQNWKLVASKDETLSLLAKFGGMARDYTYWITIKDMPAVVAAIGCQPLILVEVD